LNKWQWLLVFSFVVGIVEILTLIFWSANAEGLLSSALEKGILNLEEEEDMNFYDEFTLRLRFIPNLCAVFLLALIFSSGLALLLYVPSEKK